MERQGKKCPAFPMEILNCMKLSVAFALGKSEKVSIYCRYLLSGNMPFLGKIACQLCNFSDHFSIGWQFPRRPAIARPDPEAPS